VICFLRKDSTCFRRANQEKNGVDFVSFMVKREEIEKFRDCQAQRLEALLPWNPNGPRSFLWGKSGGSDGGRQASYEFWSKKADQFVAF